MITRGMIYFILFMLMAFMYVAYIIRSQMKMDEAKDEQQEAEQFVNEESQQQPAASTTTTTTTAMTSSEYESRLFIMELFQSFFHRNATETELKKYEKFSKAEILSRIVKDYNVSSNTDISSLSSTQEHDVAHNHNSTVEIKTNPVEPLEPLEPEPIDSNEPTVPKLPLNTGFISKILEEKICLSKPELKTSIDSLQQQINQLKKLVS